MKRVVICSPMIGVYIGSAMGMGFWSLLDCAGQEAAVTFSSEAEARQHVASWDSIPQDDLMFREIEPDEGVYASFDYLKSSGMDEFFMPANLH